MSEESSARTVSALWSTQEEMSGGKRQAQKMRMKKGWVDNWLGWTRVVTRSDNSRQARRAEVRRQNGHEAGSRTPARTSCSQINAVLRCRGAVISKKILGRKSCRGAKSWAAWASTRAGLGRDAGRAGLRWAGRVRRPSTHIRCRFVFFRNSICAGQHVN